jgi:hypothetical protein
MGLFDNDLLKDNDYRMYMNILHQLEELKDATELEDLQNALKLHKNALVAKFGAKFLEFRKII